jgi:hypothetical protein
MLSTSTTKWMIDSVHRNASHSWPLDSTGPHFVMLIPGFDQRLLSSPPTGDNTNRGSTLWVESFRLTRR